MLAKELNVPVICLSQLSRAVEQRGGDKKPILSDLRESGSIEQDADIVQFIYRPEYYGITEDGDGESTLGAAYVLTAKNRHGAIKDVRLRFKGECVAFEEWREDFERPNVEDVYNPNAGMTPDNSFNVSSQDAKEDYEEPPF
jgi:replicative DNA helicase